MRVFADSNIWLSAFATRGLCNELILRLATGDDELLASALVWEEVANVLVQKLKFSTTEVELARAVFSNAALIEDMPPDAGDNDTRLLTAAVHAGVGLFISGDKGMLARRPAGTIRILAPREAWLMLYPPQ